MPTKDVKINLEMIIKYINMTKLIEICGIDSYFGCLNELK